MTKQRDAKRQEHSWQKAILRLIGGAALVVVCAALALGAAGYVYRDAVGGDRPMPTPYSFEPLAAPPRAEATPIPAALAAAEIAAPTPDPTPEPAASDAQWAPAEGAYTIAWLSDTQYYCRDHPDTFRAMTRFLYDNRMELNLRYVIHTGDLVNNHSDEAQWAVADEAMDTLAEIPYGVLAGNHDMDGSNRDFSYYGKYFGTARMQELSYYGGAHGNNKGHYDLLSIGATPYIFVYMSCYPDNSDIAWLNQVFAQYPDRVGVLCLHDYFTTNMDLSAAGTQIFERVVSMNPNIYLVLCGHRYAIGCKEARLDDDRDGVAERTVYQMMMNYQTAGTEGGDGYLRLMQINERAGEIRMLNYSPLKDDFNYFDTPEAQAEQYSSDPMMESFTIPIPWRLP